MTIWHMNVAYWISKAIHLPAHAHILVRAHTLKYVMLIAFQWQQWFFECASVLSFMYIASIVRVFYC
jgi:hypothetical protein